MQRYLWVMLLFLFGIGAKAQNNIIKLEYWFNSDFSSAVNQTFSPVDDLTISSSIDVSSLNNGLHTVNYRFLDENEKWSPVASSFFVIYPGSGQNVIQKITQIEYWFNADYASAIQVDASNPEILNIDEMIDVSSLNDGLHTVSYRFKDERGIWGPPESGLFIKYPWSGTGETPYITEYEYRIDDPEGNALGGDEATGFTHVTLDSPVSPAMISLTVDLTQEPKGDYPIHFRAKDTRGLWGSMVTHTMTKEAFPVADFYTSNTTFCTNSAVQFVNESIDTDTWLWNFGDGNTSTGFEPEHTYTEAGDYEVTLTATDSESGRDSVVTDLLTIYPTYETEVQAEICEGEVYTWNGVDYSTTGSYTEVLTSVNGCDSTVTLNLTVNPAYNIEAAGFDYMLIDDDFEDEVLNTLPEGWVIRYDGSRPSDQKVVDDPVKNGLQSFQIWGSGWAANLDKEVQNIPDKVTLEGWMRGENVTTGGRCGLGISNPDVGSWGAYLARVEFFEGNLITFNYTGNSGGYGTQFVLQPALPETWYHIKIECDRISGTYKVYINNALSTGTAGGQSYTQFPVLSGLDPTAVSVYGNSRIYFDDIKFYESNNAPVTICESNLPYPFGTQQLTESGTYTEKFYTVHGCDSVVSLKLEVIPTDRDTVMHTVCENKLPFNWQGSEFTEAGFYSDTLVSVHSCDSIITLDLNIFPSYDISEAVTMNESDLPYEFGDQSLTESGIYEETFMSINGCDSTVTLTLTVNSGDITPPDIICNPLTVSLDNFGNYELTDNDIYDLTEGTTDNETDYSDLDIRVIPDAFSCDHAGTDVPVRVIVSDLKENADTAYTSVKVTDQIAPKLLCENTSLILDGDGLATLKVKQVFSWVYDPCGIKAVTVNKRYFNCQDVGKQNIWVKAIDNNDNFSTCVASVSVIDDMPPVFMDVEDQLVIADDGKCFTSIEYPDIEVTDNCEVKNLNLIEGLGPDGEFPIGTTVERWAAIDPSGNSDTISFEVKVVGEPANPSFDPIPDIEALEDAGWITIELTNIYDGWDCEDHPLDISLVLENNELIESYFTEFDVGDDTAILNLLPAQDKNGESAATLHIKNMETGKEFSSDFNIIILPQNDPPIIVQPVENIEMTAGDSLNMFLSSAPGDIFNDVDDDVLSLSLQLVNDDPLPGWISFRNDSLFAYPAVGDTGCVDLLLVATDVENEEASSSFTLCVSFPVGINVLSDRDIKVYPNPTTGKVYLNINGITDKITDVAVYNSTGQKVLHKTYQENGLLEIDLFGQTSGMYILKAKGEGRDLNFKIILNGE